MDVPSPQSVGREFVRQYYTLLNKAPDHLHRFYNNNSSFVHGGLDPHNREATMVIGQKQIYNKIQQLRFRDCHAKISQVDSQQTLGGGVVVQVTGELSNNGEPMRRFTQTFVLAAQSPKKYYVHNDIFRYQDLITDDENEVESRSENDEEQDQDSALSVESKQQQQPQQTQQPAQPAIFYPLGSVQSYQQQSQPAQLNGIVQHEEILQNLTPTNNNVAINNINNNTNGKNLMTLNLIHSNFVCVNLLRNSPFFFFCISYLYCSSYPNPSISITVSDPTANYSRPIGIGYRNSKRHSQQRFGQRIITGTTK